MVMAACIEGVEVVLSVELEAVTAVGVVVADYDDDDGAAAHVWLEDNDVVVVWLFKEQGAVFYHLMHQHFWDLKLKLCYKVQQLHYVSLNYQEIYLCQLMHQQTLDL